MRVVKFADIIHVLELHLDTPEAASIVLDLFDYEFEIESLEKECGDCTYSWWNGKLYECSLPFCRFKLKK